MSSKLSGTIIGLKIGMQCLKDDLGHVRATKVHKAYAQILVGCVLAIPVQLVKRRIMGNLTMTYT